MRPKFRSAMAVAFWNRAVDSLIGGVFCGCRPTQVTRIAAETDTTRMRSFVGWLWWGAVDEFTHYSMCAGYPAIKFDRPISIFEHRFERPYQAFIANKVGVGKQPIRQTALFSRRWATRQRIAILAEADSVGLAIAMTVMRLAAIEN
jgi:hypothetical protein